MATSENIWNFLQWLGFVFIQEKSIYQFHTEKLVMSHRLAAKLNWLSFSSKI